MTAVSATDAALEGFRITRERPRLVLVWALFCLAANMLGAIAMLALPEASREAFASIGAAETPDPQTFMNAVAAASPVLLIGLVVQRMMDAAVYRLMLRPEQSRFAYLRLGGDEMRLTLLRLIYLVMAIVFIAVVQFGIVIISFAASALGQAVAIFVTSIAELVSLGIIFVLAVRMSLASVITFDTGRLAILDSWRATRGQFWRLLGVQLLALCCVAVLGILSFVIFSSVSGVVLLLTGGSLADLRGIMNPEEFSLQAYLNPFVLAYMLMGSVFTAIYSVAVPAPGAFLYRAAKAPAA